VDATAVVTYREGGAEKQGRVSTQLFLQRSGAHIVAGTQKMEKTNDGNAALFFDVEVDVEGRYHASAELWRRDGKASLAFARKNLGVLPPGRHQVALLFGGEVIRDRGVDGPYAVRSLELLRTSTVPPHAADPIAEVLQTPPWRASEFF
jgi:hypothetical protein